MICITITIIVWVIAIIQSIIIYSLIRELSRGDTNEEHKDNNIIINLSNNDK